MMKRMLAACLTAAALTVGCAASAAATSTGGQAFTVRGLRGGAALSITLDSAAPLSAGGYRTVFTVRNVGAVPFQDSFGGDVQVLDPHPRGGGWAAVDRSVLSVPAGAMVTVAETFPTSADARIGVVQFAESDGFGDVAQWHVP
jgi:hypothetical protein